MNVPPQSLRVPLRPDLQLIADMVPKNARVLDVGCGDGALLSYLAEERGVDGRGIELSQTGVNACVARGLAVIQGDADTDLGDYPSDAFDEVILSQTIQATRNPKAVLENLLRIGRRVTVSFPISAIGKCGSIYCSGGVCRARARSTRAGIRRRISISAPFRIFWISHKRSAPRSSAVSRSTVAARRMTSAQG